LPWIIHGGFALGATAGKVQRSNHGTWSSELSVLIPLLLWEPGTSRENVVQCCGMLATRWLLHWNYPWCVWNYV